MKQKVLICNHKKYVNGKCGGASLTEVNETLHGVADVKLKKIITKLKEYKVINPDESPVIDYAVSRIEADLKRCKNRNDHVTWKFAFGRHFFEYNIDPKEKKAHIYKSYDDKEYATVRDYFFAEPTMLEG